MFNTLFRQRTLVGVAIACAAGSLLTVSHGLDRSLVATGNLVRACGFSYPEHVRGELKNVLNKQAYALELLGLENTKSDVCNAVKSVASAKMDSAVSAEQYGNEAHYARAVLGAAILYRAPKTSNWDRQTTINIASGFELEGHSRLLFESKQVSPKDIEAEGRKFILTNLALASKGDIDASVLKDKKFSQYVYNLNLSP